MKPVFFIVLLASLPTFAQAAVTFTTTFNVSTLIPDNDSRGYTSYRSVTPGESGVPAAAEISSITSVTVDLSFANGWNGDLYVYLVHNGGFVVLLNRIGRDTIVSDGSPGSGMTITLADDALTDVHTSDSGSGALTGIYQPDGRETDPDFAVTTSPRTTSLSTFNGLDAAGGWSLFVADVGAGDRSLLQSWSLTITAVPEPSSLWLALGGCLPVFRRRRG